MSITKEIYDTSIYCTVSDNESIEFFDPICKLINVCQNADCAVVDATELWLNLRIPLKFRKIFNANLQNRRNTALNIYALAAFYLHPFYNNNKLSVDKKRSLPFST